MRTAVSIPDAVFEEAERLATKLKISRSQLYSQALAEFLARHMPDRLTDAMNQVIEEVGREVDDFSRRAAREVLLSEIEESQRDFQAGRCAPATPDEILRDIS